MEPDDASSPDMRRPPTEPDADPLALDDETVERLLRGELPPAQAPPGYAEVAALLAATTAPPSPQELSGQAAALAELRSVTRRRRAAGTQRFTGPPRRRRAGLAAVVLVGAVATGGVAAAATGRLPAPVRDAARTVLTPWDDRAPTAPPGSPGAQPGQAVTSGPASTGAATGSQGSQPTGTTPRGPASTAGPAAGRNEEGRCRAYLAGQGGERGGKLDATAFQALARAAGGEDRIAEYCAALLPGEAKPKDDKPKDEDDPGGQGQDQGQEQGQGQGSPPGPHVTQTAP
jgi:hypothetical protein